PVPSRRKSRPSPSKQLLKIDVPLHSHKAGINRPVAQATRRVTPNLSHILRVEGDSLVRSPVSKAAQFRADSDEFMLVIAIPPVTSFAVPVTVMMMMPIFIVPVVISTVFVSSKCQRCEHDHC